MTLVYAVRNTLQFFTIPVGYFLGGFLVDDVLEPWMAAAPSEWLRQLFGTGLGSGAAVLFAGLGVAGVAVCLLFRNNASLRDLSANGSSGTELNENDCTNCGRAGSARRREDC